MWRSLQNQTKILMYCIHAQIIWSIESARMQQPLLALTIVAVAYRPRIGKELSGNAISRIRGALSGKLAWRRFRRLWGSFHGSANTERWLIGHFVSAITAIEEVDARNVVNPNSYVSQINRHEVLTLFNHCKLLGQFHLISPTNLLTVWSVTSKVKGLQLISTLKFNSSQLL